MLAKGSLCLLSGIPTLTPARHPLHHVQPRINPWIHRLAKVPLRLQPVIDLRERHFMHDNFF